MTNPNLCEVCEGIRSGELVVVPKATLNYWHRTLWLDPVSIEVIEEEIHDMIKAAEKDDD